MTLPTDNWLRIVTAKRLLGRDLTPEEEADVWENGLLADCVRHLAPAPVKLGQQPVELSEDAARSRRKLRELRAKRSFAKAQPKRDDDTD